MKKTEREDMAFMVNPMKSKCGVRLKKTGREAGTVSQSRAFTRQRARYLAKRQNPMDEKKILGLSTGGKTCSMGKTDSPQRTEHGLPKTEKQTLASLRENYFHLKLSI